MSLKAFHFVFLFASVVFCLGFGLYAVQDIFAAGPRTWPIVFAVGAAISLGALLRYSVWVRVKLLQESYL